MPSRSAARKPCATSRHSGSNTALPSSLCINDIYLFLEPWCTVSSYAFGINFCSHGFIFDALLPTHSVEVWARSFCVKHSHDTQTLYLNELHFKQQGFRFLHDSPLLDVSFS